MLTRDNFKDFILNLSEKEKDIILENVYNYEYLLFEFNITNAGCVWKMFIINDMVDYDETCEAVVNLEEAYNILTD